MIGQHVRTKPPHNVSVLERWLSEESKHTGIAAGRLRRWLGFMVVAAMLDKARRSTDSEPLFLVKGGVALELRIGVSARATKDLDLAFVDKVDALADHVDPILRAGHADFTATRTPLESIKDTGAIRCNIKLAYRGRPVITVKVEVATAEGGMGDDFDRIPAKSLDHVGLIGPESVPCVAIRWQIAQKLHACTEAFDDRENDRFRDLIVLQLLADLITIDQWPAVRAACVAVFEGRAQHSWPPVITVYRSWEPGYRSLAEQAGFDVSDVHVAADSVRRLVASIDAAKTSVTTR